jgi:anti-sigma regulatory factor (Ser/Thr protein kinase)
MAGDRDRQPGPQPAFAQAGGDPEQPAGKPVLEQAFDGNSLYALRAAVAAHAAAAGLVPPRLHDLVAAAHELAANAVRHGAGHGQLRLLAGETRLYCQVSDKGPAGASRTSAAAGGTPWPVVLGHGLWLVRRVCDQVSIHHGPGGTTATAAFTISSPPRPQDTTAGMTAARPPGPPDGGDPSRHTERGS